MIVPLVALAVQAAASACQPSKTALRANDQALLDAFAPANRGAWEKLLTPDAVYVDENGAIMARDAFLKSVTPLPPNISGHLSITDYRVRFEGDSALVIHRDDEQENYHGIPLRAGYLTTETWLCRDGRWKLALIHAYVEAKDPPAIALSQSALGAYEGRYSAAPDLVVTLTRAGDHLVLQRKGRAPVPLLAETPDVLFAPGQPRIKRIFLRDAKGRITAFIDRREGEDIVWKRMP
jgi:hypothetical protein